MNNEHSFHYYQQDIKNIPLLSKEEEMELIKRIKNGDKKAQDEFIERNLKLVPYIAQKYENSQIPICDMIQEGNLALINAVKTFDPSQGYTFSTYASHCIYNKISSYSSNYSSVIDYKPKFKRNLNMVEKFEEEFSNQRGRKPTIDDIEKELGLSKKCIENLRKYEKKITSLEELIELEEAIDKYHNTNDNNDFNSSISELETMKKKIPSIVGNFPKEKIKNHYTVNNVSFEDIIIEKDLPRLIQELLNTSYLFPNEIKMIEQRFGLSKQKSLTLEQIGKQNGNSKEVTRRKINKTLLKLKPYARLSGLDSYITDSLDNPKMK